MSGNEYHAVAGLCKTWWEAWWDAGTVTHHCRLPAGHAGLDHRCGCGVSLPKGQAEIFEI